MTDVIPLSIVISVRDAERLLEADCTCWSEGQVGVPPRLLLAIRDHYPALASHRIPADWARIEEAARLEDEAITA